MAEYLAFFRHVFVYISTRSSSLNSANSVQQGIFNHFGNIFIDGNSIGMRFTMLKFWRC